MEPAPVDGAPPLSPDLKWVVDGARKIAADLGERDGIVGLDDAARNATRETLWR